MNLKNFLKKSATIVLILGTLGSILLVSGTGDNLSQMNTCTTIGLFIIAMLIVAFIFAALLGISEILQKLDTIISYCKKMPAEITDRVSETK